MNIGPQYNVYMGTRQTVWYRDINEQAYSFTLIKAFGNYPSRVLVSRETYDGWERVHCFTA